MLTAVTGASGHIGNNLVRHLLARGHQVRALVHRHRLPLEGLAAEIVSGDILDRESLVRAFSGAEVVFHLAGLISIMESDSRHLQEVNLRGTRNVISACRQAGVRRLVYTSSVETLLQPGGPNPLDEQVAVNPDDPWSAYSRSKHLATREVFQAAGEDLEVVVVYPTAVVGPGDWRPSLLGRTIIDFAHHRLPCLVDGGFDFVDVRDVAAGLLLAAERGQSGQGYLLGGQYLSIRAMAGILARCTGTAAPRVVLPLPLARAAALLAPPFYRLTGASPRFTPQSLRVLAERRRVLHRRAHDRLGYLPRRAEEAFEGAVEWFAGHDKIRRVFFSRRDLLPVAGFVLVMLLCLSCGLFGLLAGSGGDRLLGLGALLVGLGYLAISWPVRYEIDTRLLHVRAGLLHLRVPRQDITAVEPSRLPIGAPAWSFHRLRVFYRRGGKTRSLLLAPEQRREFLSLVKADASRRPAPVTGGHDQGERHEGS
ncbi:MAG: hypothetical protein DRI34_01905 [Deltaproteobacteria bacterium]|nr:MAG: hypothetical protein DRI34_01905 [Deltaproteobacteria bacterium]